MSRVNEPQKPTGFSRGLLTELDREDKKKLLDAASQLAKAFSDFRCEVERLQTVHTIVKNIAGIELPADGVRISLAPFEKKMSDTHHAFCELIGASETDNEFWDWYEKQPPSMEELKERVSN